MNTNYSVKDFIYAFIVIVLLVLFSYFFIRKNTFQEDDIIIDIETDVSPKASQHVHRVLFKFFPYYTNLDADLQNQFLLRVVSFLNTKEFIPRQGTSIPNEMPLLVAASAVQLSFGLLDFSYFSFDKILIYPTAYYSNIRKEYHQGEINIQHRLIVLSATHFLGGISVPDDGKNLGLHELAHALNIHAFDYEDYEFIERFKAWEAIALQEMTHIERGNHFIRPYASSNMQEMFAVCVENFFERPQEFHQKLPQLYTALVLLLRQNPLQAKRPILTH